MKLKQKKTAYVFLSTGLTLNVDDEQQLLQDGIIKVIKFNQVDNTITYVREHAISLINDYQSNSPITTMDFYSFLNIEIFSLILLIMLWVLCISASGSTSKSTSL